MKKIVVTVGISGAGKSTWSHEQWKANPTGIVVVNRDSIRNLLFAFTDQTIQEYYTRPDLNKLEKQVTKYEDTLINEALCEDKTVIVDATHLEKKYLTRFEFWNVPIEYKYFDVALEVAALRDSKRSRSVGAEVIKRQYNQYMELQRQGVPVLDFKPITFENNVQKHDAWVFDIDNTIAKMNNRNPYDWKNVEKDSLDASVAQMYYSIKEDDANVIFCSGRDEICRDETMRWLKNNLGKFDSYNLMMRPKGDQRPDWIVKEELWRKIAEDYYIVGLIDDRNQVCRRARSLGLKVYQVEYGNF